MLCTTKCMQSNWCVYDTSKCLTYIEIYVEVCLHLFMLTVKIILTVMPVSITAILYSLVEEESLIVNLVQEYICFVRIYDWCV